MQPQQTYFTRLGRQIEGPFSQEELAKRQKMAKFGRHYHVSTDRANWVLAADVPELFPAKAPRTVESFLASQSAKTTEVARPPATADADAGKPYDDEFGIVQESPAVISESDVQDRWYYARDGREYGPVSFSQLQFLVGSGQLCSTDHVIEDGMVSWMQVQQYPALLSMPVTTQYSGNAALSPPTRVSGWAIASLVCGLLGISLLAIIFGHVALAEIRGNRAEIGGRGIALTGTILGYIGLFLTVLAFFVAIAVGVAFFP